jgi:hypothetical protein
VNGCEMSANMYASNWCNAGPNNIAITGNVSGFTIVNPALTSAHAALHCTNAAATFKGVLGVPFGSPTGAGGDNYWPCGGSPVRSVCGPYEHCQNM